MEMTAKCTKLKVLELTLADLGTIAFVNVINKSTSLQTLLLGRVQLSDMVSPP